MCDAGVGCRGAWHLHPTALNEAVYASGKQDLISLVHLQIKSVGVGVLMHSLWPVFAVGFHVRQAQSCQTCQYSCSARLQRVTYVSDALKAGDPLRRPLPNRKRLKSTHRQFSRTDLQQTCMFSVQTFDEMVLPSHFSVPAPKPVYPSNYKNDSTYVDSMPLGAGNHHVY